MAEYKDVMAELVKLQRERATVKAAQISESLKTKMLAQIAERERVLNLDPAGPLGGTDGKPPKG